MEEPDDIFVENTICPLEEKMMTKALIHDGTRIRISIYFIGKEEMGFLFKSQYLWCSY